MRRSPSPRPRGPLPLGLALHRPGAARGRSPRAAPTSCPIFLSDIPGLFTSRQRPARRRAPPALAAGPPRPLHARHLGRRGAAAADSATLVVAEINEQMPRTHGNTVVPLDRVDAFVASPTARCPRPSARRRPTSRRASASSSPAWSRTARRCRWASAASPTPCSRRLGDKHDLGVHTEMFSDGVIDLVEAGVVTNRLKEVHPGRIVTSFVNGTARLYDFVDDNPMVEFHPCDRTNDTAHHPQEPEGGRHQLGHRDRPHRPGVRRLDRPPHLLGHRRADGLHPRRGALARAASRSSRCRRRPRGGQVSRIVAGAQARRRRRDDARPRPLGRHRARRGRTCTARRCASAARRSSPSPTRTSAPSCAATWPTPSLRADRLTARGDSARRPSGPRV